MNKILIGSLRNNIKSSGITKRCNIRSVIKPDTLLINSREVKEIRLKDFVDFFANLFTRKSKKIGSFTRNYLLRLKSKANISKINEILTPESEIIHLSKFSMISKPNRVQAFVPDLSLPDEKLIKLGLIKENGQWFVPNREWFPGSIKDTDIVINYGGMNANGTPNMGYYAQKDFSPIYVLTKDYDAGIIRTINAEQLPKSTIIHATKCASGGFCVLPENTLIKINGGISKIKSGQVVIINDSQNNIFVADIGDSLLKRYIADPMNPSSNDAFNLLKQFQAQRTEMSEEELSLAHKKLLDDVNKLQRGQKLYKVSNNSISAANNLKTEYELASKISQDLDEEIFQRIDALDFSTRLEQAREVLQEVIKNNSLTPIQKDIRISAIQVRLLPKANNHQHLKGSVPEDTIIDRLKHKGMSNEKIAEVEQAYLDGRNGFENLDEFNNVYSRIAGAIQTPKDYQLAIKGIIEEATKQGQVATEIRCSVIGQRDEKGMLLSPDKATENIIKAIKKSCGEIRARGGEPPKTSFVFLGYRGKDWKPEEVLEHAQIAVKYAKKYPDLKFGFDLAGPEETGYRSGFFKDAFKTIRDYNNLIKIGEIKGETVGITIHAGETPKCDGLEGPFAVLEAIEMGANRIGHGIQAIKSKLVMKELKKSGATVEICGVCNISSIPKNTKGLQKHPIQEFIRHNIPITLCTDNDSICCTNLSKEYMQFLLTGHDSFMNWNTVKQAARNGIDTAFIPKIDKAEAHRIFDDRVRQIENLVIEARNKY